MTRFTFGDEIKVKESAPISLRPGSRGAVVSIQAACDQTRYTVEFDDGSDCAIEEGWIDKVSD